MRLEVFRRIRPAVHSDELCSKHELVSYTSLVVDRSAASTLNRYLAKRRIESDFFHDIASYLYQFYSGDTDFKRYVTPLGFSFGADYFQ